MRKFEFIAEGKVTENSRGWCVGDWIIFRSGNFKGFHGKITDKELDSVYFESREPAFRVEILNLPPQLYDHPNAIQQTVYLKENELDSYCAVYLEF